MTENSRRTRVIVAGYYASGDGYPNGFITQRILSQEAILIDMGRPMSSREHLWRIASSSVAVRFRTAWHFLRFNVESVLRVLVHCNRERDLVYVRYPAVPFMLLMRFVPSRLRPNCYVDGFISLWETMFRDRTATGGGLVSRFAHALERLALSAAHRVLVDTCANAEFMCREFALEPSRVIPLPLGVDEERWRHVSGNTTSGSFVVIFVGTFVPLHGFDLITSAIDRLDAEDRVRFVFVGDGQDAGLLERLIAKRPDLDIEWRRGWYAAEDLARIVAGADACLGVFGGEGKAARVLPYKLYLYLLNGRPIVTQSLLSAPVAVVPPVFGTRADAGEIVAAIRRLRDDVALRTRLSNEGRAYYDRYLCNSALANAWRELLAAHGRASPSTFTEG